MKNLISVIFSNFFGYDIIIFLVAAFNFAVYFSLNKLSENLYNKMHLTIFAPRGKSSAMEAKKEMKNLKESDIISQRRIMGKRYSLFVNITGIFPLLGILGTIISLLGLASDMSNVQGNFYGALTSTFWGVVFAVIFKFLDGIISPEIEDNEKSVELFLEKSSENTFDNSDNTKKQSEKADENEK